MPAVTVNSKQFISALEEEILGKAENTIKKQIHNEVAETMAVLFGLLAERSPVKTGRFRGSWNASVGAPDRTVRPKGHSTRNTGKAGVTRARRMFRRAKLSDNLYITNALDYSVALAFGSSRQAATGWVDIAMEDAIRATDSKLDIGVEFS
jgi:hypothetical protein